MEAEKKNETYTKLKILVLTIKKSNLADDERDLVENIYQQVLKLENVKDKEKRHKQITKILKLVNKLLDQIKAKLAYIQNQLNQVHSPEEYQHLREEFARIFRLTMKLERIIQTLSELAELNNFVETSNLEDEKGATL